MIKVHRTKSELIRDDVANQLAAVIGEIQSKLWATPYLFVVQEACSKFDVEIDLSEAS